MSAKEQHDDKAPSTRYDSVDGFRAIVHVSLVALHAAMLTSGHLPSEGEVWETVRKHPVYTWFQAGGTQVDIMFMLSGYLLVDKLLNDANGSRPSASVAEFTVRRMLRFIPALLAVSLLGLLVGDVWDGAEKRNEVPALGRILSAAGFVMNYLPPAYVGSFTLSLFWSCCVDLQAGMLIVLLVGIVRSLTFDNNSSSSPSNALALAYRLRWLFLALTAASVAIRAALFEVNTLNLFKLGQYSHFGLLMTDLSYGWISDTYGHVWLTENTAVEMAQGYLVSMYNPTHTRIGPVFVGAVVACNVFLAWRQPPPRATVLGRIVAWLATLQALAVLVVPCLPPADDVPVIGQHIATAALRTFAACAAGLLLYRARVPPSHAWHWGGLEALLSLRAFRPVAVLSYCSYLVHFRILMECNFQRPVRRFLLALPALWHRVDCSLAAAGKLSLAQAAQCEIEYIPRLFVLGLCSSLLLSLVLYNLVEKPAADALSAWWKPAGIRAALKKGE